MHHSASKIDLSKDGDSSVVGWMEDTTFKVSSQVSGMKIMANEDSGNMFNGYKNNACQNVISITGLEKIDTSSVKNMTEMFSHAGYNATTLSIGDISNWDTSSVVAMTGMFYAAGCNSTNFTTLDLSGWNTSSLQSTYGMFDSCSTLKTIYVGDEWDMSALTASTYMFSGCKSLVGQSGTTYNSSKVDKRMANYETGYLTYKAPSGN